MQFSRIYKCLKRTTMDDDGRKPIAFNRLSDSSDLKTLHAKPHTLVVRPVVDADVSYSICTSQVYCHNPDFYQARGVLAK